MSHEPVSKIPSPRVAQADSIAAHKTPWLPQLQPLLIGSLASYYLGSLFEFFSHILENER
jgi:hypothetical protein